MNVLVLLPMVSTFCVVRPRLSRVYWTSKSSESRETLLGRAIKTLRGHADGTPEVDTVVELWGDHFQLTEMSLPRSKPIFITSLSRSYVNRPPCDSNISPVSGSSGLITQPFPF